MKIIFKKKFDKQYSKLNEKLQQKVDLTITRFAKNPFDGSLYNHPGKGNLKNLRSIKVTGDMRILFEQHENYTLVLMLAVGTHSQLY